MKKLNTFFLVIIASLLILSGCASGPGVPNRNIPLEYPIVLVSGLAKNDRGKSVKSWGRIPELLRKNGFKIFFGNTDAWGNIESNSEILKTTIDKVLMETESEKVNIIAHSKGGIDSRYFIWKYEYTDKVASLTTISTPHHGSEIVDFIYGNKRIHTPSVRRRLLAIGKLYGDVNPNVYNSVYELTTEKMAEFNKIVTMDNGVYYQSIYTTMSSPSDDRFFFQSYNYIKSITGENDGLVSEYSAKWGDNIIKIEGSISHEQIIDHRIKRSSLPAIINIYFEIIEKLSNKGL